MSTPQAVETREFTVVIPEPFATRMEEMAKEECCTISQVVAGAIMTYDREKTKVRNADPIREEAIRRLVEKYVDEVREEMRQEREANRSAHQNPSA